jgi:hypothetical protein
MGSATRSDPTDLRIEAAEYRALALREERIGMRRELERRADELVAEAERLDERAATAERG